MWALNVTLTKIPLKSGQLDLRGKGTDMFGGHAQGHTKASDSLCAIECEWWPKPYSSIGMRPASWAAMISAISSRPSPVVSICVNASAVTSV